MNIQVSVKKLAFLCGFRKTFSVSKLLQKPAFTWMWEYRCPGFGQDMVNFSTEVRREYRRAG